jgi:mono/diheme cytochrome c family protein
LSARTRGRSLVVVAAVVGALGVLAGSWARAQDRGHTHDHAHDDATPHLHAPVPPDYASAHVPSAAWTDPRMIARGKEIFMTRCAVCHGDTGDGKGPAGLALPLKPPDLRDVKMVSEMAGNYWFWRISEGGAVEPFKSMGSAMPAWKGELSVEDRWAVIAYQHTFSGHDGPHVVSEHPQLVMPVHADHTPAPAAHGAGHKH